MFNLLVHAHGGAWENEPYSMPLSRLGEYSDPLNIRYSDPESISALIGLPTLLAYEELTTGPNQKWVRFGKIIGIKRVGAELKLAFELDIEHPFIPRKDLFALADELGIHRFESSRTHWAVKQGILPDNLFVNALRKLPTRTLPYVVQEYLEAKASNSDTEHLEKELESFPPSVEKVMLLSPDLLDDTDNLSAPFLLETDMGSADARNFCSLVKSKLDEKQISEDWVIDGYRILDRFGGTREREAKRECSKLAKERLVNIRASGGNEYTGHSSALRALLKLSRCRPLAYKLAPEVGGLLQHITSNGIRMTEYLEGHGGVQSLHDTALCIVILQRLGDDRYREIIQTGFPYWSAL